MQLAIFAWQPGVVRERESKGAWRLGRAVPATKRSEGRAWLYKCQGLCMFAVCVARAPSSVDLLCISSGLLHLGFPNSKCVDLADACRSNQQLMCGRVEEGQWVVAGLGRGAGQRVRSRWQHAPLKHPHSHKTLAVVSHKLLEGTEEWRFAFQIWTGPQMLAPLHTQCRCALQPRAQQQLI